MIDFYSVGDTSHNVFLGMTDETVKIITDPDGEHPLLTMHWGEKMPVETLNETIGGNSSNAATSFARLGFNTVFYTHVGKDHMGREIIDTIKKEGITDKYIAEDGDKGSNFSTVINLHGERSILVYHEHRHYSFPDPGPAAWMYLSSMGEGGESIFPDIIEYVKANNTKLCYQPGTFQLQLGKDHSKELLQNTHIFMVNKEEAEMYLGFDEPTEDFGLLLNGIRELGPKIALVTDGTNGAYASDGEQYLYLGIIEAAPRNEATGAGDSFSSGFAAGLAKGLSLGDAMRWGQAQASGVIQKIGGQAGLYTEPELQAVLDANPKLQAVPMSPDGRVDLATYRLV